MELKDKIIIVTGGASGIGLALCTRFVKERARVILSDRHAEEARLAADAIGATAITADVSKEEDIAALVNQTLQRFGRIDMFCSNAGIVVNGGAEASASKWKLIYDVNVMAHVYAAKYVLPHMLERGDGYLLNTASAAGLLTEFHAAAYATTKHAAVGFAEWLAITYGDKGIKVSVLCPAGVRTPMAERIPSLMKNAIEPAELAEITMQGISEERFLISTHDFVTRLFKLKGNDYQEYINIMSQKRADAEQLDEKQDYLSVN